MCLANITYHNSQDGASMSRLITYLFKKLGIKIKTVATYYHQSLQEEHGI